MIGILEHMTGVKEETVHLQVCRYISIQYPHVLFNTDLSGIKLTQGQAVKAKRMRACRAFPDIVIYEPRKGYHGLFLELKREGTRLLKKDGTIVSNAHIQEQEEMLKNLRKRGFKAEFAIGFDQAKGIIDSYLR